MNEVFGSVYANAYDVLYHDKDYAAECDFIERIAQMYGDNTIHSVLDLGCGTGSHAFILAQRGYEVVGVDRSEGMLATARKKLLHSSSSGNIVFQQSDIRRLALQRRFDSVLMMFAVLGYQLENADILLALHAARQHVHVGGLFIFDVWYGPAVLHQRPSQRVKVIPTPEGQLLRVTSGQLDTRRHLCTVHYHMWRLEREKLVGETEESHRMRYFFPLELEHLLECNGFALLRLGAVPEFEHDPDEMTWNVLGVARAV